MSEKFSAHVQYDDFKGTASADKNDRWQIEEYLKQKNVLRDGDYIVGVEFYSGENHEKIQNSLINVAVILCNSAVSIDVPAYVSHGKALPVRKIRFQVTLAEFFGFYKRFSIKISRAGWLTGKSTVLEDDIIYLNE